MNEQKSLLLVDDEPANIDLLRGILPAEFKIRAAISGDKALMIAQKAPCPDLILLDVMMPGMDGYEVCRQLKSNPVTAGIPVIFVSGHVDQADREKGLASGAVNFITKPIDPGKVNAAVRAALA